MKRKKTIEETAKYSGREYVRLNDKLRKIHKLLDEVQAMQEENNWMNYLGKEFSENVDMFAPEWMDVQEEMRAISELSSYNSIIKAASEINY